MDTAGMEPLASGDVVAVGGRHSTRTFAIPRVSYVPTERHDESASFPTSMA